MNKIRQKKNFMKCAQEPAYFLTIVNLFEIRILLHLPNLQESPSP